MNCATGWRERRLGDLFKIKHGFAFEGKYFATSGPFVLLTPGNFYEKGGFDPREGKEKFYDGPVPDGYILERGDLLVAMTEQAEGLLGSSALVPESGLYLHNQRLGLVCDLDEEQIDKTYLYYLLNSKGVRAQIQATATGTKVRHTAPSRIYEVRSCLPPLVEQQEVAHILGTLDDKIELNRQMNQTLEQIAAALFRSWFIDFDPVRAKMLGREPEGMDAATAALFPERLMESEVGEIPEGWRQATVSDVADVNAWTLGKSDELDVIEYIDISSVMRGEITSTQTFNRGDEPSRARRRLRHGDTVLSTVRPDRGAYFLSIDPRPNHIASTGFAVVSANEVPWSFLHAALTQPEVFNYLGRIADGGAYPAVRPEVIGGIPLILPSVAKLLDLFQSMTCPLFVKAGLNRQESQTLSELRDSLLPRLLSGQVKLQSVEASKS